MLFSSAAKIACQIASTTFQCDSLSTVFLAHFIHMFLSFDSRLTCGTFRNRIRVHYPIYETINDTILSRLKTQSLLCTPHKLEWQTITIDKVQSFFFALVSAQFNTILSSFRTIYLHNRNLYLLNFHRN